ncbi:hypothetical protein [Escherichia coli]|uniref:hypothetical protein n=1 Tax=Escherichia coli TaxID=562 RepID=UPI003DA09FE5
MVSIISSERWMLPLRVPLLLVSGEIIFGGLAPEGKIGVWLEKPDKPNIRLTDKQILIETVSGEKMEMCKGISRHDFSLGDDEYVLEFIKDKKYPYGNW